MSRDPPHLKKDIFPNFLYPSVPSHLPLGLFVSGEITKLFEYINSARYHPIPSCLKTLSPSNLPPTRYLTGNAPVVYHVPLFTYRWRARAGQLRLWTFHMFNLYNNNGLMGSRRRMHLCGHFTAIYAMRYVHIE